MTTVTGTLIGIPHPDRIEVTATLVDATGQPVVGYVAALPGELIRAQRAIPNASTGAWSLDLTPNSAVTADAGDTLWRITEGRSLTGTPNHTYIVVPASGGPYWLGSIRAVLADTPTGTSAVTSLVQSVNGQQGVVVLDAAAVGADPAGAAAAAQTAATTAATDALAAHTADTTSVHGIADTTLLETTTGAQAKADAAQTAATAAAATDATAKVTTHTAAADPHGDRAYSDTTFATKVTVAALNGYVDDTAARIAAVENGTAWLAGVNSSGPVLVSGADLTVKDNDKGYRFRRGGSALDLEATGADLILSNWSGTGFNGTQYSFDRYASNAHAAQHAGLREFVTSLYGTVVHTLDPSTGIAALGARNALTNVRLAGRRTSVGPPTSGTWDAGDTVQDSTGAWWLCTGAGTPGTWQTPAAPGNEWTPADQGLAGWTFDPASCTGNGTTLSAGFIYLMQIVLRNPATLTKVHAVIGTAGSGLTAGQCLAGLYDTAGNRVAVTGDMATVWNTAGNKTMTLTGSYAAPAGKLYVAFLFNGTTSPTFACGSTLGATFTPGNANLTSGTYRFCRSAAGQTALPATITLSGYTPDANNVWSAAS